MSTPPNTEPEVAVALTADAAQPFSPVEYYVSGAAKDVYVTYHKLEKYASALGQWYSRLTIFFRDFWAYMAFLLLFTAPILVLALAI